MKLDKTVMILNRRLFKDMRTFCNGKGHEEFHKASCPFPLKNVLMSLNEKLPVQDHGSFIQLHKLLRLP